MGLTGARPGEGYGLDPAFEAAVAALAASSRTFWSRVGHAVDPAALDVPAAQTAFRAAAEVARDLGRPPGSYLLVIQRLRRWQAEGKVDDAQIRAVSDLFEAAEERGLPDETAASDELAPVVRRRAQRSALSDAVKAASKRGLAPDLQEAADAAVLRAAEKALKAASIGKAEEAGLGVAAGSEAAEEEIARLRMVDRLPTGISPVDLEVGGGMPCGCLGVLIGASGEGKSMALCHVAAEGWTRGLLVAYATLELPVGVVLARAQANAAGVPIDSVLDGSGSSAVRSVLAGNDRLGALRVRSFTPQATTVADVHAWLSALELEAGRRVDLLVVDYADKMVAPGTVEGRRNSYETGRLVFEGLRVGAAERGYWAWTASQARRRDKGRKSITDLDDVSDSMEKVRVADLVVTINSQEDDLIVWRVAKNRHGAAPRTSPPTPHEFAVARVCPVDRGAEVPF